MDMRSKFLLFVFCTLLILSISATYYRFVVLQDYLVLYEGECDPYTQVCFTGCEDDDCTSEYYYSYVEKYAPNLYEQCGPDITECNDAYICLEEDIDLCTITYCDPEIDGESCELLTENDFVEEEEDELEIYEENEQVNDSPTDEDDSTEANEGIENTADDVGDSGNEMSEIIENI